MKDLSLSQSAVDCPLAMLGHLKPSEPPEEHNVEIMRNDTVIHGVTLSRQVVEELQRLGISLNWYSASQLKDAAIATHHDGQLIDDPNGVHFRDQLTLTNREMAADNLEGYPYARMRVKVPKQSHHNYTTEPEKKPERPKDKSRGNLP